MAASTIRPALRVDLSPSTHWYFEALSTSEIIQVGDLVQVNQSTRKAQLLAGATVSAGHKFYGISNSYWSSTMNDQQFRNLIEVIGVCIFEVTVASGTYQIGDALEYDASAGTGRLKSWETGNQLIAWVFEADTGTITSLKAYMNVFDPSYNLMESSS